MYAIVNGYMLTEMSQKEFLASDPDKDIKPVSTAKAHQLVRDGICHSTPLWVDDNGRIRRADSDRTARPTRGNPA